MLDRENDLTPIALQPWVYENLVLCGFDHLHKTTARTQKDGPTKTVCERSLTLAGNTISIVSRWSVYLRNTLLVVNA